MIKKLIYIALGVLLAACQDELSVPDGGEVQPGTPLQFQAVVADRPRSRVHVIDVHDNAITRDFKAGDSFGMFIIDADNNFVSEIDGHNAHNIKLTTPDGKAWNLNSEIKEVVHKLGYRYVAYYPYSEAFNDCASIADIQALLTPPPADQSAQEATDWMYTDITEPQTNAVTTLTFYHRFAKIDIYNSFTQDHQADWVSAYQFTKTVDDSNVEHYRYIVNAASPQTLSVSGTYTIGNALNGIKQLGYSSGDITIENGRHAIVYTYRVDERCAIDLGFPSGVMWSPINFGTETGSYMDDAAIAAARESLGKRLAWGELYEKDTYTYVSYMEDYYAAGATVLPSDIAETTYDPVRQYWGGHWTLPNSVDIQEFIDNTDLIATETIHNDEINKDIYRLTFRSKINGQEITILTSGYINNTSVSNPLMLFYLSSTIYGYTYCATMHNSPEMKVYNTYRYMGFNIRPVLKDRYIFPEAEKKDIVVNHINDIAVDLGITKEVDGVTYKVLWSPFNYGVERQTDLVTYNNHPLNEDLFISNCTKQLGMRLAWGTTEETDDYNTVAYNTSALAEKYNYNASGTDKDVRDLKPEDDVAQINWPEGWCLPTAQDFQLLVNNVTVTNESINGITWFRLTSKINGNSILIPASGYIDGKVPTTPKTYSEAYLPSATVGPSSSTVSGTIKRTIYALRLNGTTASIVNGAGRCTGLMVRPVRYVRVD